MYKKQVGQIDIYSFVTPFEGGLNHENRWVKWADNIPWDKIEAIYASKFSKTGAPAKPLRLVLGSHILKREYKMSDQAIIDEIAENPYLQYFIGLNQFVHEIPVSASLLRTFIKRFTPEDIAKIEKLIKKSKLK